MKVGIDGVLLGAWTDTANANSILDIGTGTGLIALMLAQRSEALITAIDIDSAAIEQATQNIAQSPWSERITAIETSIQHFVEVQKSGFDLIVSNPPYFVESLKAGTAQRTIARHTDTLTHEELMDSAQKLLTKTGRMCIILPVKEGLQCIDYAKSTGFYCSKVLSIYPTPTTSVKRLLIEFKLVDCQQQNTSMTIESETRHQYSREFTELAKPYYLKL